jgi:hypothetical protein
MLFRETKKHWDSGTLGTVEHLEHAERAEHVEQLEHLTFVPPKNRISGPAGTPQHYYLQ